MNKKHESGFSIIEGIIIVLVLGLLGFVGYTFYTNWQASNQPADTTIETSSNTVDTGTPEAPKITTVSDLDEAQKTLDSVDVEASEDTKELNQQSAF